MKRFRIRHLYNDARIRVGYIDENGQMQIYKDRYFSDKIERVEIYTSDGQHASFYITEAMH